MLLDAQGSKKLLAPKLHYDFIHLGLNTNSALALAVATALGCHGCLISYPGCFWQKKEMGWDISPGLGSRQKRNLPVYSMKLVKRPPINKKNKQ